MSLQKVQKKAGLKTQEDYMYMYPVVEKLWQRNSRRLLTLHLLPDNRCRVVFQFFLDDYENLSTMKTS